MNHGGFSEADGRAEGFRLPASIPNRRSAPLSGRAFRRRNPQRAYAAREREIADHPSIKPQSFLRRIVYAALPLGEGMVADPFMGSGQPSRLARPSASRASAWNGTANTSTWQAAIPRLKTWKPMPTKWSGAGAYSDR